MRSSHWPHVNAQVAPIEVNRAPSSGRAGTTSAVRPYPSSRPRPVRSLTERRPLVGVLGGPRLLALTPSRGKC